MNILPDRAKWIFERNFSRGMNMPTNIWFTSDHHFGHTNIIKYNERPFESVEEMDETMIANWNDVVRKHDVVWHLGDFTLSHDTEYVHSILRRLNGDIYFIFGGHDKYWYRNAAFNNLHYVHFRGLMVIAKFNGFENEITLCHYPLLAWEKSHYGSVHLHGHLHNTDNFLSTSNDNFVVGDSPRGIRINVGVEFHLYKPVHLDTIRKIYEEFNG